MPNFIFTDDVDTELASPFSSTATQFTLASAINVPSSIPAGSYWVISLKDAATEQNTEIIYVGSISGATCSNLLRGQEGTVALSWNTGDYAFNGPTAGQMKNFVQGSYTNVFTTPGYRISPDGFIEQWGTAGSNSSGIATVTFPIPFPNGFLTAIATPLGGSIYNGDTCQIISTIGNTGMKVAASNPVSGGGLVNFIWNAKGY